MLKASEGMLGKAGRVGNPGTLMEGKDGKEASKDGIGRLVLKASEGMDGNAGRLGSPRLKDVEKLQPLIEPPFS